jgi:hypothetical protein
MKKVALLMVMLFSLSQVWAQETEEKEKEDRNFRIPLIGETAPSFTAESTGGLINFPSITAGNGRFSSAIPRILLLYARLRSWNCQSAGRIDKLNVKLVVCVNRCS